MDFKKYLNIHPEVENAITEKKPVVALESTIIAHGMPYPKNVQTAMEVEDIVRKNGAIPATIAILNGKICVGLNKEQLEMLGNSGDVWKVSLRDMPYVVSKNLPGATTVAATMRIAAMAGIKIFVTGGIGGVHRGAEKTMDISADLIEMSRTNVAVVSAGVKSILDIGLTLEFLETHGIPVITYSQDGFPAFYSRNSGFRSPLRVNTANEISNILNTKWELGLDGSVLIANPIPENIEVPKEIMEVYIKQALKDAIDQNIEGKEITPFLLKSIVNKTGGDSLKSNIALVKNNAELGAKIAKSLIDSQ
ncbi:MAG: pseudouridine-5-phosphate glycosidase [Marinilabiliales bacterium]|nr:MAG: pseudouridine-5-phosphate glycosidase [Marinilabiliales bacterium]